jgi:hypothetical protein
VRLRIKRPASKDEETTQAPAPETNPATRVTRLMHQRLAAERVGPWKRPILNGQPLEPRLPRDLTQLNDQQLGRLLTEFCIVLQWAKGVHTLHAVEAAEAVRYEKIVRAKAFLAAEGNRETRSALVETDRAVVEASERASVADAMREMLYAVYDGYLVGRDAISRELTRRIELERHRGVSGEAPTRRVGSGMKGP